MQIELTGQAQAVVEQLLASGKFQTADEAVDFALRNYSQAAPTLESLNAKLQEAHVAFEAGDCAPLDAADVKRRGRERLAQQKAAE